MPRVKSEDILTVKQAAELLNVAPSTVYKYIRVGVLPSYSTNPKSNKIYLLKKDVNAMKSKEIELVKREV